MTKLDSHKIHILLIIFFRMNPALPSTIKELFIMGGNYKGVGNVTIAAEFNFFVDPMAAHIVIEEFGPDCPTYLITWELSRQLFLKSDDIIRYCNAGNKRSDFKKVILAASNLLEKHTCGFCDAVAVAVALYRDMIKKTHKVCIQKRYTIFFIANFS